MAVAQAAQALVLGPGVAVVVSVAQVVSAGAGAKKYPNPRYKRKNSALHYPGVGRGSACDL
jgi:hypothetical protein